MSRLCRDLPQERPFRRRQLRPVIAPREEVPIDVEGHADRRMPKPFLDKLRRQP
jgi:hypothetical protein